MDRSLSLRELFGQCPQGAMGAHGIYAKCCTRYAEKYNITGDVYTGHAENNVMISKSAIRFAPAGGWHTLFCIHFHNKKVMDKYFVDRGPRLAYTFSISHWESVWHKFMYA